MCALGRIGNLGILEPKNQSQPHSFFGPRVIALGEPPTRETDAMKSPYFSSPFLRPFRSLSPRVAATMSEKKQKR